MILNTITSNYKFQLNICSSDGNCSAINREICNIFCHLMRPKILFKFKVILYALFSIQRIYIYIFGNKTLESRNKNFLTHVECYIWQFYTNRLICCQICQIIVCMLKWNTLFFFYYRFHIMICNS